MAGREGGGEGGVRVAVRVRPFNGRERQLDSRLVVEMAGETQVMIIAISTSSTMKSTITISSTMKSTITISTSPQVSLKPAAGASQGQGQGEKHRDHNFAFDHVSPLNNHNHWIGAIYDHDYQDNLSIEHDEMMMSR